MIGISAKSNRIIIIRIIIINGVEDDKRRWRNDQKGIIIGLDN